MISLDYSWEWRLLALRSNKVWSASALYGSGWRIKIEAFRADGGREEEQQTFSQSSPVRWRTFPMAVAAPLVGRIGARL
jgi:hypothetical protein